MDHDQEYIFKLAKDQKVKFIRLWFTDILGFIKSFAITIDELEDALTQGVRFDGATLQGSVRTDEREMIAMPDSSTFAILPWRPKEDSVARLFCNIQLVDGHPYEGDCRYILNKNLQKASEVGYSFYTGPEIEFFFFRNSTSPEIRDRGGYFDLTPLDEAADYRRQTVLTLEAMGIDVISSHHEVSHSQHEIDLRHEDALAMADNIMTFKVAAKEVGQLNNIYASFMPKPLAGQNGSGLHIHASLFNEEKNIFFDSTKEYNLSDTGKKFIAGILRHCKEFMIITNQWINSYKRLVEGFESPTLETWSIHNPAALIRIPECQANKPNAMRIELRNPDPACNPYLLFACMLNAGLKGIKGNYELQSPLPDTGIPSKDDYQNLPSSLEEAIKSFENSELMIETLGDLIHKNLIANKKLELKRFNSYITDYEIQEYLPKL
jgi:glutamine synthetase